MYLLLVKAFAANNCVLNRFLPICTEQSLVVLMPQRKNRPERRPPLNGARNMLPQRQSPETLDRRVAVVRDSQRGVGKRITKPKRIASARRRTMIRSKFGALQWECVIVLCHCCINMFCDSVGIRLAGSTLGAICATTGSTATVSASARQSRRRSLNTSAVSVSMPGKRRNCTVSAVSLTTNLSK